MSPKAKRKREYSFSRSASPSLEVKEPQQEHGAVHLVSFLTSYEEQHFSDENVNLGDEDEEGSQGSGEEHFQDDMEDDGDDGGTPRYQIGLLPSGASTPRSKRGTPKKTKTPGSSTSIPRRTPKWPKEEVEEEGGIIRPSKADNYFTLIAQSGKTSGNSYSLLADTLSQTAYEQHTKEVSTLRSTIRPPENAEGKFDQWTRELEAGFNLLFYGFGSKRPTLNHFAKETLAKKGNVVVINGLFPGMGIKDIVSEVEDRIGVPQDIVVSPSCTGSLERAVHRLYAYLLPPQSIASTSRNSWPLSKKPLFLVIHNIDSPSLRTAKSLAHLALLASSPRIHVIASFDHVHTPLIFSTASSNSPPHAYPPGSWDGTPQGSRGFNWVNHNLTTYAPYDLELTYLRLSAQTLTPSTNGASGVSEEGALQILKSVTPMAARLLKLILTLQLRALPSTSQWHVAYPAQPPGGTAPPFASEDGVIKKLAKDKFIAREEERYKALMGEYKDHGLVVDATVGSEDGGQGAREGRWLWVPLGKAAVERLLESMAGIEV
ncbi:uncharacterized protein L203_106205 [Cryptococcus depauperatus CBS 7841]|uniref:Origin recognition complex subunit 2 n=1 Tax=Cryptococcus depauperatus CBS 7841 TaxID=1295531 RepID=A0A1E3IVL8_9TREE|nr:hypothetical protein L203_00916 [Cryptococcus depauperatus CBS 7841]